MITTSTLIQRLSLNEFHQVDRIVTGLAFDIHNELGRFLDEKLYQRELAARCLVAGLRTETEMRIAISLDDFTQHFRVDLLVNEGVVTETKAVHTLNSIHKGQALNYLFLCGTFNGTLLVCGSHGVIGNQEVHLLTPEIAFAVTSATHHAETFAEHQKRFLRSTPLKAIAWINLNHHNIEIRTIVK